MNTPAERVKRIRDETDGVAAQYGLSSWDRNFLDSISTRASLSPKQAEMLTRIEVKVFREVADEDEETLTGLRPTDTN